MTWCRFLPLYLQGFIFPVFLHEYQVQGQELWTFWQFFAFLFSDELNLRIGTTLPRWPTEQCDMMRGDLLDRNLKHRNNQFPSLWGQLAVGLAISNLRRYKNNSITCNFWEKNCKITLICSAYLLWWFWRVIIKFLWVELVANSLL